MCRVFLWGYNDVFRLFWKFIIFEWLFDIRNVVKVIFGSRGCIVVGFCGSRSVDIDLGSKIG